MKINPFSVNMNMVKLNGKKVLVWSSQAESTKGTEVIIGPPMQFHLRWLGLAEGFGHEGYYVGDDR
jgi:hypothetical protein